MAFFYFFFISFLHRIRTIILQMFTIISFNQFWPIELFFVFITISHRKRVLLYVFLFSIIFFLIPITLRLLYFFLIKLLFFYSLIHVIEVLSFLCFLHIFSRIYYLILSFWIKNFDLNIFLEKLTFLICFLILIIRIINLFWFNFYFFNFVRKIVVKFCIIFFNFSVNWIIFISLIDIN